MEKLRLCWKHCIKCNKIKLNLIYGAITNKEKLGDIGSAVLMTGNPKRKIIIIKNM